MHMHVLLQYVPIWELSLAAPRGRSAFHIVELHSSRYICSLSAYCKGANTVFEIHQFALQLEELLGSISSTGKLSVWYYLTAKLRINQ